jgi:hypothetical protein
MFGRRDRRVEDEDQGIHDRMRRLAYSSNAQFIGPLRRREILRQLQPGETPEVLCLISKLAIDGEAVITRWGPWLLVTDRRVIIVKLGDWNAVWKDLRGGRLSRLSVVPFDIRNISYLSDIEGRDFEFRLADGRRVTVRGRPWLDKKSTLALHRNLAAHLGQ